MLYQHLHLSKPIACDLIWSLPKAPQTAIVCRQNSVSQQIQSAKSGIGMAHTSPQHAMIFSIMELRYFRDVDLHEVDFVLREDGKPLLFIESKTADLKIGKGLSYLHRRMPQVPAVQIVLDEDRDFIDKRGVRVCGAARFLGELV